MSYINQKILTIPNPRGLDAAIASVQQSLSTISYLTKIFGRAYVYKENRNGSDISVPKVYTGTKEYENVLFNDNYTSMCFFLPTGPSVPMNYVHNSIENKYKREVSIIFWGNLKRINPGHDYVFSELIKSDFLKAISNNPFVNEVKSIEDDTYDKVFKDFRGYDRMYEGKTQLLQYPYVGLNLSLELVYSDGFACGNPSANQ